MHSLKFALVTTGLTGMLAFAPAAEAQPYRVVHPAPVVVYPARPVVVYRPGPVIVRRPYVRRVVYAGPHGCIARTTRVWVPGRGHVVRRVAGCR